MHFYESEHNCMCLLVCLSACSRDVCFPVSHYTSFNHTEHTSPFPPPPTPPPCWLPEAAGSAVQRSGDCRLGDHYKGHKRAIYRTASEWSQHGPPPSSTAPCWVTSKKAQNGESEACGVLDDLNMKVRDVAALLASGLGLESQTLGKETRCYLIFHV